MIHKLESAGLGYHVSADETEQKLGMYAASGRDKVVVVLGYHIESTYLC